MILRSNHHLPSAITTDSTIVLLITHYVMYKNYLVKGKKWVISFHRMSTTHNLFTCDMSSIAFYRDTQTIFEFVFLGSCCSMFRFLRSVVAFCRSLFVPFLLVIVLSVLLLPFNGHRQLVDYSATCLSVFLHLWILITPLLSSNSSIILFLLVLLITLCDIS